MCSTTSGRGLQLGDWVSYSLCCRYITEEDGVVILRKYNAATRINWCVLLLYDFIGQFEHGVHHSWFGPTENGRKDNCRGHVQGVCVGWVGEYLSRDSLVHDLVQVHCCVAMMNWQVVELVAQH